jgi:endonuclease/exonuclease/phosphatase family metal-dependent hydrolase
MACTTVNAQEKLTITTWNIEHLGSPGRGFGGGFGGFGLGSIPPRKQELPRRTDTDLKKIAAFIRDDLKSDLLALQEIAITARQRGRSKCEPLDKIVTELEGDDGDWSYFLPPVDETPSKDDAGNEFLGFLWNRKRVRLLTVFEMRFENQELAGKALFDRKPLVGYFEALKDDGSTGSDFVLVNLHMASGQDHDENHLIAMTLIQFELASALANHAVSESDIIILGDFNDNPSLKKINGKPEFSSALYVHMEFKGYVELSTADLKTTRMNSKLDSLIDHILVSKSAQADVSQERATIFKPGGGDGNPDLFGVWRLTFSDHFPLSFEMKIQADTDVDFFK